MICELNILLTSISSTVQGFPLPAMKGCVNLLRTLHERWEGNEQADLLDDGNILTFLPQDTAEVFPVSSAPERGICCKCRREIKCQTNYFLKILQRQVLVRMLKRTRAL
jgi:hypothetical protein